MAGAQQQVVVLLPKSVEAESCEIGNLQLRSFCHPKGHKFLLAQSNDVFYEVQSVQPRRFGSWFLEQRVSSSKNIYLANLFDVRFLLLPHFEKAQGRFSPLEQIIQYSEGEDRLPLTNKTAVLHWKLESVCDVNDQFGEELLLYRYSAERVRKWLRTKVERTATILKQQRIHRESALNQSFVSTFNAGKQKSVITATAATAAANDCVAADATSRRDESKPVNSSLSSSSGIASFLGAKHSPDLYLAIELVSDYLTATTTALLLSEFQLTAEDVKRQSTNSGGNSSSFSENNGTKKRKADWEQELELEKETLAFAAAATAANANTSNSGSMLQKASNQATKMVRAEKMAVAAKGTASLHSFFQKKK